MGYAIMRWGKIKFGGIAGAEYHQRTELHKNCEHPEMRDSNFTVKQFENETLRKTVKRFMMQQEEQTGRKLRKDATVLVDFVFTFSPEMIGKIDMQKWIDANIEWLKKEFGAKNLLRFDMHWHESTPHLHAFVLPLDDKGKFNFKHYVRHVSQLVGLQDRYAEAMKPFDLERGKTRWQTYEEGKPQQATDEVKRHTPLRAWRQQMVEEIKLMEQKLKVNEGLDDDIGDKLELLQKLQQDIESRRGRSKSYKEQKESTNSVKSAMHSLAKKQVCNLKLGTWKKIWRQNVANTPLCNNRRMHWQSTSNTAETTSRKKSGERMCLLVKSQRSRMDLMKSAIPFSVMMTPNIKKDMCEN